MIHTIKSNSIRIDRMTFSFGLVDHLDYELTLYGFIGVIGAIILFDYITGVLEFFLEDKDNHLYNRMVQVVYKELTFMGLVSLAIIMFEAGMNGTTSHQEEVILAIDFAHIVLFYMTIFFVLHAFFLIKTSLTMAGMYRRFHSISTAALLEKLRMIKFSPLKQLLLYFPVLPFSFFRDKAEYKIFHTIFSSCYLLPENFNYPAYLSRCFARFALRIINRSVYSWLGLLLLIVINVGRIGINKSCQKVVTSEHRRLADDHHDDHHEGDDISATNLSCDKLNVTYFLFCGCLLCFYSFILLWVSSLYRVRLLKYAGVSDVNEYIDFLAFKHEADQKDTTTNSQRFTVKKLKEEIREEWDREEYVDDEEGFKALGQSLLAMRRGVRELIGAARMELKVWVRRLCCPKQAAQSALSRSQSTKILETLSHSHTAPPPMCVGDECALPPPPAPKERKENQAPLSLRLRTTEGPKEEGGGGGGENILCAYAQHKERQQAVGSGEGEDVEMAKVYTRSTSPADVIITYTKDEKKGEKRPIFSSPVVAPSPPLSPSSSLDPASASASAPASSSPAPSPLYAKIPPSPSALAPPLASPYYTPPPFLSAFSCCSSRPSLPTTYTDPACLSTYFNSIYLFSSPMLYYRSIEIGLMCNCLYMSLWATNYISIVQESDIEEKALLQICMLLPFMLGFAGLAYVAETCSLLQATTEINMEVVYEVLEEMEATDEIVKSLRSRIINAAYAEHLIEGNGYKEFISSLFSAVDRDGSGYIDRDELRELLRKMHLTFTDRRFKLLYYAIDASNGDGKLSEEELQNFLFPPSFEEEEMFYLPESI